MEADISKRFCSYSFYSIWAELYKVVSREYKIDICQI